MLAAPLYAAMAVCAALVRARSTGRGCRLDVAALDAAAAWKAEEIDAALNGAEVEFREMTDAVRYQYYRTADERVVVFQASERKFWRNFCTAVGRPDLYEARPGAPFGDHAAGDEPLRRELAAIFRTRTGAGWVRFFLAHDVPGGPVHTVEELPADPHFQARDLLFAQEHPVAGSLRLFGMPVKVEGEAFSTTAAPAVGEHTDQVLGTVLGLSRAEIDALRAAGVV
jgi:crotonobetainyl-CoA:carnitine CoA-transferase CaiB-like acyl-CoA transferase